MTITHRTTSVRAAGALATLATLATLALPAALRAQDTPVEWRAMLGCWRPLSPTGMPAPRWSSSPTPDAPVLCILPEDGGSSAELVTIAGDSITGRDTIDIAAGVRHRERDRCTGSESASWSADGARLYMKSQYSCPAGLEQKTTGVLALSTGEELLDIQQTTRGVVKGVRVSRYVRVPVSTVLPRAEAVALEGTDLPLSLARGAAAAPLTNAAIAEASRSVDPEVVEALLVERGDEFTVDAKRLAQLSDAGVPGRTTDVMVALAYPHRFLIQGGGMARMPRSVDQRVAVRDSVRRIRLDPFTLALLDPSLGGLSSLYPFGYRYSPYGYGTYGAGYGGYGYGGFGYYGQPIVVVRNEPPRPHGRVVNGRGYERGDSGDNGGTAQPRTPSSGSTASSGGSSGSSSSGSSSSSSSGSSSGETRTAKPRP